MSFVWKTDSGNWCTIIQTFRRNWRKPPPQKQNTNCNASSTYQEYSYLKTRHKLYQKTINHLLFDSKLEFDPNNPVVKLCSQGMDLEGLGQPEEAVKLFFQAWNEAISDFEKFIAAHYIARHQKSITDKLKWDETALKLAQKINSDTIKVSFPSLYLNIAKCYEDLNDYYQAIRNYQLAFSFTSWLPDNGYGNMVKTAILNGTERVSKHYGPGVGKDESLT